MNKKQLMMLFSLAFLVSVFAVGTQSGVTATTETVYQIIEMPLSNDPLYSTNSLENSGGSGCTASTTTSSFKLNELNPGQIDLQASVGYMAFDGFKNESNNAFVPFVQDPTNKTIIFPSEGGEYGQAPNIVEQSGFFQDRPPDWSNITAVFVQGTPNPLTNGGATNYLQEFFQFEKIVNLTDPLENPLVVAELRWKDCDAVFQSDLVINGFVNETGQTSQIHVNDTTSNFIDFSNQDGRPTLLVPTANWYDMDQRSFNITGVWNLTDYNTLKTLDQNVLDPSNMLLSWSLGPDGRSPELVELKQSVSDSTDLVVSVTFEFQNDCSCERWYYVEDSHGVPFLTTRIAGKGALNLTDYDFGFYEDNNYQAGSNHAWKRWLKAAYLVNEYNQSLSPQDPQTVKNYYKSYDDFENIVYLEPRDNTTHLLPGTHVVLVVVEEFCPPQPEGCWFPYYLDQLKDNNGVEREIYPVFESGQPLIRLNDYGWQNPYMNEIIGVYNYSEFDSFKDPIEDQTAYNYLDWFDGADNKIWLRNDNGISAQTKLVIVMVDRNCPCAEGRVVAGLDGYWDTTNNKFNIFATGTEVDISMIMGNDNINPSFAFEELFLGEEPQWNQPPREINWLGAFSNGSYNFGVGWKDQTTTNYFLSYDPMTNRMQLTSAPGDSTPLILVAEVVWKCGCFETQAEIGVSVFFNEQTNTQLPVYASGNVVNLPQGRPEKIEFFHGMGPGGDNEPSEADILGIFVNATYDFNLDWSAQGGNLLQSYDATNHRITLNTSPGDSVELLVVMKLFWYCDDDPITTTTSANPTTTSDTNTITTSPGFELIAILLGLAVFGITVRRRN